MKIILYHDPINLGFLPKFASKKIIFDHLGSCPIILVFLGFFEIIFDHLRSFRIICDHLRSSCIMKDHVKLSLIFKPFLAILCPYSWLFLRSFANNQDHLRSLRSFVRII